tara:strand:- start:4173 stop:4376 length:204 start_codon:yes stop_codon:yes gene_type:complete
VRIGCILLREDDAFSVVETDALNWKAIRAFVEIERWVSYQLTTIVYETVFQYVEVLILLCLKGGHVP